MESVPEFTALIMICDQDAPLRAALGAALDGLPTPPALHICADHEEAATRYREYGAAALLLLPPGSDGLDGLNVPPRQIIAVPFRLGALLDRLQNPPPPSAGEGSGAEQQIPIGPYLLEPEALWLLVPGEGDPVRLTEKERDILLRLHQQNGAVIERKTLLDDIWGYADGVETHTLETHIYRLRRKIERDPARPAILLTEENGYRLG